MTAPAPETTPLEPAWDEVVREIPEKGLERRREATDAERADLARALDLLGVDSLEVTYRVRPGGAGRYVLKGSLTAQIRQACVVSLQPLTAEVRQDLDMAFWPAEDLEAPDSGAVDLVDEPEPEPIEDGRLPVGRLVYETFAAAIDPFPRAPDAKLEWEPKADGGAKISPFAALAKLKKE